MEKREFKKRLIMTTAVFVALVLSVTAMISYAWLAVEDRKLGSLTGVEKPAPFKITGPYGDDGADIPIDFIGVNVPFEGSVDEINRAQYLFCIEGISSIRQYDIVIAHTTNVDFTYSLFKASREADGVYSNTYSGQSIECSFFYSGEEWQFTGYNRAPAPNESLAQRSTADPYYAMTYKDGDGVLDTQYVQKNAVPIYEYAHMSFSEDASYTGKQYYILNVTWTVDGENDSLEGKLKETDMVYIFVKTVTGS